ncbi:hypothetical protein OIU84_000161 [Salix udensis]|uniref:Uncharacterized protein n=1 Tax=Salix udensis TaxID=889485 RepID=A0AAD6PM29_9ROSI|nr:hypothetical protein OIU84_000161 [Salix udensis]
MDQIRKTMMQHESLFKEQVQALHKLYNIQKSEMQEIKGRNYSQAQVLAFNPESLVLCGRPKLWFCSGKETVEAGDETCPPTHRKPVRNFDLEKVPEDDADLEGMPKQWRGSDLTESTELFQDPVKYSQDSSILEPTELDEFNNIQRSIHLETNSNLAQKNLNLPVVAKDSSNGSSNINLHDVSKSSASSTLTVSEIKHTASNSHSNGDHGNTTSLEKIPDVTVGNQNKKGKSALSEECESLAAEILLSFAPSSKSQADTERHSSESAKSYGDLPTTDEKPDLCQKRCATFSSGGRVYEYLSRTNSANRI